MSNIKEARRLVEQYDLAFKNGRQKLFEEREVHIGVLQVAIATLEQKINDLSEEIENWSEAIAFGYGASLTIPKWMILHRFVMFLLRKHVERKYDEACKDIDYASHYKADLEYYLNQFMLMKNWRN